MKPMIRTTGAAIAASPRAVTASPAKNSHPMTPIIHPRSFPTTRKNKLKQRNHEKNKYQNAQQYFPLLFPILMTVSRLYFVSAMFHSKQNE